MLKFRRMPLGWQLTLLITLISSVTLAAAFGSYFFLEVLNMREEVIPNFDKTLRPLIKSIVVTVRTNPEFAIWQEGQEPGKKNRFGLQDLAEDDTVYAAAIFTSTEQLLETFQRPGEIIPRPS